MLPVCSTHVFLAEGADDKSELVGAYVSLFSDEHVLFCAVCVLLAEGAVQYTVQQRHGA